MARNQIVSPALTEAYYDREKVFQQEDAQRAVQRAEEFVDYMEQLLPSLLTEA